MGVSNSVFSTDLIKGPKNLITDVPGVKVGNISIKDGPARTGVTTIIPHSGDIFHSKCMAASYVINGFGKSVGLVQIDEMGTIESPIVMTNTLSIGTAINGLYKYMLSKNKDIGRETGTINPVVLECNDGKLNDIRGFHIKEEHVTEALTEVYDEFKEGSIGAGVGMTSMGFKGGIGSASRELTIDGQKYYIGALVLNNYGRAGDLVINGKPLSKEIESKRKSYGHNIELSNEYNSNSATVLVKEGKNKSKDEIAQEGNKFLQFGNKYESLKDKKDKGSICMVLATDIPLNERQLKRLAKRSSVAISRAGSYLGNGSGDLCVAFSNANLVDHYSKEKIKDTKMYHDEEIDEVFRAAADALEESVISSLYHATTVSSYKGIVYYSLQEFLK